MSDQEPWQRRARRPEGSIDPVGHIPLNPPASVRDSGSVAPSGTGGRQQRVEWRSAASFGPLIGLTVTVIVSVVGLIGLWQARGAAGNDRTLWLLVAVIGLLSAVAVGYLLSSISTIRYLLGDEALTVRWRHSAHVIPYSAIDEVIYDPRQAASGRGWELFWPGFYAYSRPLTSRTLRVVATLDARRRVAILTTGEAVELSPERPVLFLSELDRRRFGVTRQSAPEQASDSTVHQSREITRPARPPQRRVPPSADPRFRPREDRSVPLAVPENRLAASRSDSERDRELSVEQRPDAPEIQRPNAAMRQGRFATVIWLRDQFREQLLGDQVSSTLLAAGVVVPLLMIAFLFNQSAGLPDQIPLHWDAFGAVDEVGEPRDLWRLPLLAFVLLIGNTATATLLIGVDRFLTRLLLAATPVVQCLAFVALLRVAL